MTQLAGGLAIGKVSEATGLSVHALRFFEREALFLHPIRRSAGGQRLYDAADVDWLILCNRFRESGMSIATMREFAELVRSGPGNEPARLALLRQHEQAVREKITALTANLDVIHGKVVVYEKHVAEGTAAGLWAPGD